MSEPQTSGDELAIPSELKVLHDAITATMVAALPQVRHVEAYPVLKEGMKLPALIYAMTAVEPATKPGDGRLCVRATFEACILVESKRKMAPLQAAILAAKLMQLLDEQYWDVEFVDQVRGVQAMPSEMIPELARCTGWSVLWQQDIYLGDTEWPWENEPPGSLVFVVGPDAEHVKPEELA
ncbi:hypothetical protein GPJ81_14040 [Pseudomonas alkylphenolica]|uniref:Phage protein n=1 Tax=Pseudomonas alkylphenolica TaxID=237609 RepID=A0A6I6GXP0_9PSED|nr:hypothetical protein [Pseudomonas alkylphenolica]QGW77759.1 hypothetical protein GPJ81_14040 [Pseudomonas alkylphenolica]